MGINLDSNFCLQTDDIRLNYLDYDWSLNRVTLINVVLASNQCAKKTRDYSFKLRLFYEIAIMLNSLAEEYHFPVGCPDFNSVKSV